MVLKAAHDKLGSLYYREGKACEVGQEINEICGPVPIARAMQKFKIGAEINRCISHICATVSLFIRRVNKSSRIYSIFIVRWEEKVTSEIIQPIFLN